MSEYDRFSDRTRNLIAVLVALCVMFVIGAITYGAITTDQRNAASRDACIAQGGVFTNGVCAWSKP
jgi:TRAP-type C4-dicarboxylate transport system permease small subunit